MKVTVEEAAKIIAEGGMVIVTDHEDRENEGDLVGAAVHAGPDMVNFMASRAKGLICCAMDQTHADQAGLELLPVSGGPEAIHGTRFMTPVDVIENCTTGISAYDRSVTLKRLAAADSRPEEFARPGHMFPILEAPGGLAVRQGHTEGSLYLMRQAGVPAVSVICEMMDDDGGMVRGRRIDELAAEWNMGVLSVQDLVNHEAAQAEEPVTLPMEMGDFRMEFLSSDSTHDHFSLFPGYSGSDIQEETFPEDGSSRAPLVRIHSECLTGDLFGSRRCDCGSQLEEALKQISAEGQGYLIYLRQEGRGIGLRAKMKTYRLQEEGMDTLDANLHLGYPADDRDYGEAAAYLKRKGIREIRLMTNNPDKIAQMEEAGIRVHRIALLSKAGDHNRKYMETKQLRMGHLSA
ncbi:MAG: GTP cyclohydrolase II [Spirochaetales bacterium]|nr:GTP cyclohydrolase II [Spirochaetales bacterium]